MRALPRRRQHDRRDDVLLRYVREAPEFLAEVLLEIASDIADAYPRFGDAVPPYARLAHELTVQRDDDERRGALDRFLDAMRDAWRP